MEIQDLFLQVICQNRPLAILQLLDRGIDINLQLDELGSTPLMVAAIFDSLQIVRILHEKGADLNRRTVNNSTALTAAIKANNEQIACYLVEAGCQLNIQDISKQTPLMFALHNRMTKLCKLLITKGADCKGLDTHQNSTLILASKCDMVEVGKMLIDKGVDMNHHDLLHMYPLSYAIQFENIEFAEMLIKKGSRLDKIDYLGNTPMTLAIMKNQEYIVDLLIAHNACMCHGPLEKAIELDESNIVYKIKTALLKRLYNEFQQTSSESICSRLKHSMHDTEIYIFKSDYALLFESLDEKDIEEDKKRVNPILPYLVGFEFQEKFVQDVMNSLRDHIETLTLAENKLSCYYSRFISKLNTKLKLNIDDGDFGKLLPLLTGNSLIEHVESACTKKQKLKKLSHLLFKITYFAQMAIANLEVATSIFDSIDQFCKTFNILSD